MPKTIRKYYKDGGGKKNKAKKERSAAKKRTTEKAKRAKEEEVAKGNEPPHRQGWTAAWSDKYNRLYWYNDRNETTWDDPAEGDPTVVPSEPRDVEPDPDLSLEYLQSIPDLYEMVSRMQNSHGDLSIEEMDTLGREFMSAAPPELTEQLFTTLRDNPGIRSKVRESVVSALNDEVDRTILDGMLMNVPSEGEVTDSTGAAIAMTSPSKSRLPQYLTPRRTREQVRADVEEALRKRAEEERFNASRDSYLKDARAKARLGLEQSQRILEEAAEEEAKRKKEEEELENTSAKLLQSVLRSNQSQKQLEKMRQAKKEDKASTLLQSVLRTNQSQKDFKDRLYTIKEGNIPPEYSKRQRRIDLLTKQLLELEEKYRVLTNEKDIMRKELHKLKNTKTEKQKGPEAIPEPEPESEAESRKQHKKTIKVYPRSISKEEDLLDAINPNGWETVRKRGGHPIYRRKLTLTNKSTSGTYKLEINQQVTGISTGNIPKIVDALNRAEKELQEYENMGFKIT